MKNVVGMYECSGSTDGELLTSVLWRGLVRRRV
jgi:hypothetical protein